MTKAELIKALEPYPDDVAVMAYHDEFCDFNILKISESDDKSVIFLEG